MSFPKSSSLDACTAAYRSLLLSVPIRPARRRAWGMGKDMLDMDRSPVGWMTDRGGRGYGQAHDGLGKRYHSVCRCRAVTAVGLCGRGLAGLLSTVSVSSAILGMSIPPRHPAYTATRANNSLSRSRASWSCLTPGWRWRHPPDPRSTWPLTGAAGWQGDAEVFEGGGRLLVYLWGMGYGYPATWKIPAERRGR